MIGVYDYTVLATYLSLAFGVSGILAAMNGGPYSALLCLMVSGLLDAFDGRIARTKKNRTEQEKRFGIQIDSLNDVVCFGVLPRRHRRLPRRRRVVAARERPFLCSRRAHPPCLLQRHGGGAPERHE